VTLTAYMERLRGKKAAVLGIGVSNRPLIDLLCAYGVKVTACDKKTEDALGTAAQELREKGVELKLGATYLDDIDADIVFRTPGMRPDLPALEAARAKGSVVTSEMEVFFEVCPCPIVAVTGSDGKTTTTTLVYTLLKQAGYTCHLGGNIGHPLLADVPKMTASDYAVVELSSFQLMTMQKSPKIAIVTNLSPNHLDIHKGMDEYVDAKKNIFLHQSSADRVVFNADNDITASFVGTAPAKTFTFSRRSDQYHGVYCTDGIVKINTGAETIHIMQETDILLPGKHNLENYMAAIAAVWGLVSVEDVKAVAKTFKGVAHRTELVREWNGVKFYNDSIATSPTRVIAGLRTLGKVILIAGGYDKNIPFDALGPEIIKHAKALVLCGATADKIRKAVTDCPDYSPFALPIHEFKDFKAAVEFAACDLARPGDIVTLSPACAAFDQFKNFEERGNYYKKLIMELDTAVQ